MCGLGLILFFFFLLSRYEIHQALTAGVAKLYQSLSTSISDHTVLNMVVLLLFHCLALGIQKESFDTTSMAIHLFPFLDDL